jgi:hypothetical protein
LRFDRTGSSAMTDVVIADGVRHPHKATDVLE